MLKLTRIYSALFAFILMIAESIILIKTNKYWPLSVDDYIAVGLLAYSVYLAPKLSGYILMLASWAYVTGNLYAMLFMRLHPVTGSGERIQLLIVAIGAAVIGCVLCSICIKRLLDQVEYSHGQKV